MFEPVHDWACNRQQQACCRFSRLSSSSKRAVAVTAGTGPIVVIDNYDSFTYNLVQNDEKSVDEIRALKPAGILVSPGPGKPTDSGISLQAVRELGPDFPLFGVCMGHQCIGEAFGGAVVRAPCGVMHGKTSPVFHTDTGVLQGLDNPFQAAATTAWSSARMPAPRSSRSLLGQKTEPSWQCNIKVSEYPHIQGVQFHPESIITQNGKHIVANFLRIVGQDPQESSSGAAAAEPSLSVTA
ncbi:class I glutamine amidotransferase-like protein [Scenedesmus sp. NREL 46B-D3]|nr:class I glutamine amidotransferase-like protein [Scenedesmus sp. NREL 46B-D3]